MENADRLDEATGCNFRSFQGNTQWRQQTTLFGHIRVELIQSLGELKESVSTNTSNSSILPKNRNEALSLFNTEQPTDCRPRLPPTHIGSYKRFTF